MLEGWFRKRYVKFKGNGELLYHTQLKDCKIDTEINGDYRLSFDVPDDNDFLTFDFKLFVTHFNESRKVYEEISTPSLYYPVEMEYFTINSIEYKDDGIKYWHVEAPHILMNLRQAYVLSVDDMIGATVGTVVDALVENARQTSSIIDDYGLTVTVDGDIANEVIDFEKHEKVSLWDSLKDIIDILGFGEMELRSKTLTLKRVLAENVTFPRIKLGENCKNIDVTQDHSTVVTKAYVFGKDDLTIGTTYITSSNINNYGERVGIYEFSEIDDVTILESRASWLMDTSNPERIDLPKETVTADVVHTMYDEVTPFYRLGATVPVVGGNMNDNQMRITSMSFYLFEPQNLSINLGKIKTDLWQYLKRISNSGKTIKTIVNNTIKSGDTVSKIEEISKETVVAADVIESTAAFSENMFTDYLETNLISYVCIPNLKLVNNKPQWNTAEGSNVHTYTCANHDSMRGCIVAQGIHLYFKEEQLVTADDYTKLTTDKLREFKVNGKQLYFTSVLGSENAYKFLTFTEPREKYPSMSADNAEMFKVYLRGVTASFIKAQFEFKPIASTIYGQTYDVRLLFGTGINDGDKGKAIVKKDENGFYFSYVGRTDGVEKGVYIDDDNINIKVGNSLVPAFAAHVVETLPQDWNQDEFYVVTG